METFSALLAICAGNLTVTGEFPSQRPVTRTFDVFFDLRLNKRLCKQSWGWWFETLSRPLWRHCNVTTKLHPSRKLGNQCVLTTHEKKYFELCSCTLKSLPTETEMLSQPVTKISSECSCLSFSADDEKTAWHRKQKIIEIYHQTTIISQSKSQNLTVYRLVLQLSLPNSLKPGLKSRMKM